MAESPRVALAPAERRVVHLLDEKTATFAVMSTTTHDGRTTRPQT